MLEEDWQRPCRRHPDPASSITSVESWHGSGFILSRKRTLRSRSRTVQSDRRVENAIIGWDEPILVTGASGFIGTRVVRTLLEYGFRDVGCFVRSARGAGSLESLDPALAIQCA